VAATPPDSPATPAPISDGVLGMARTTTEPAGRLASSRSDEMPATIESTRRGPDTPRARRAASATSGFTASRTSSASVGPLTTVNPGWAASSLARCVGSVSLTAMSPIGAQPAATSPLSRAEPIFPPPTRRSLGAMSERYQRLSEVPAPFP
jgi:hypothetical protein